MVDTLSIPPEPDPSLSKANIWVSIFGWKALFRWDALGAVVPGIFIAAGLGMLGIDWFPYHLLLSQICFAIAGILCVVKIIGHAIESKDTVHSRWIFGTVLCAICVGGDLWIISAIQIHKELVDLTPSLLPLPKPTPTAPSSSTAVVTGIQTPSQPRYIPKHAPVPTLQSRVVINGDVHQYSEGPCSPNNIGSGNITNCTPVPTVTASRQTQTQTINAEGLYETRFTITTNVLIQTGDLKLKCSGPVLKAGISRINPASLVTGSNGPNPADPNEVIYELGPEMLSPGKIVTIAVYSRQPVMVLSGSIGPQTITF